MLPIAKAASSDNGFASCCGDWARRVEAVEGVESRSSNPWMQPQGAQLPHVSCIAPATAHQTGVSFSHGRRGAQRLDPSHSKPHFRFRLWQKGSIQHHRLCALPPSNKRNNYQRQQRKPGWCVSHCRWTLGTRFWLQRSPTNDGISPGFPNLSLDRFSLPISISIDNDHCSPHSAKHPNR